MHKSGVEPAVLSFCLIQGLLSQSLPQPADMMHNLLAWKAFSYLRLDELLHFEMILFLPYLPPLPWQISRLLFDI